MLLLLLLLLPYGGVLVVVGVEISTGLAVEVTPVGIRGVYASPSRYSVFSLEGSAAVSTILKWDKGGVGDFASISTSMSISS